MDPYDDDGGGAEAVIEDDEFLIYCEGEVFVCKNPKLSGILVEELKKKRKKSVSVPFSLSVTRCMIDFMNTGRLDTEDVDMLDLARAAHTMKIQTLIDVIADHYASMLYKLSETDLKEELHVGDFNYDDILSECLWIFN